MAFLILLRHGQSQWNLENRFTGWVDVPLTELGEQEVREAGRRLKKFQFGIAFTSELQRAWKSLEIVLSVIGQTNIPVIRNKALNERNYGELQGMNKDEADRVYGTRQVEVWRRGYDAVPPGPGGESLKDTAIRTMPFLEGHILPCLGEGKNVLVMAHGNSLRSIAMRLEQLTEPQVSNMEFVTGIPRLYQMNADFEVVSVRDLD